MNNLITTITKYMENNEFSKLVKLMCSKEIHQLTEMYLTKANNNETFTDDELETLKFLIKSANLIYNYSGESTGMTDSEYDVLYDIYRNNTGDESIITEPLTDSNNIVHHKYKTLRGTLDKIYKITDEDVLKNKSQRSLTDWVNQSEKRYKENTGKDIDLWEEDIIVMPKFDGVSCVFECNNDGTLIRALTRGDTSTNEAQDITHLFNDWYIGPLTNAPYSYGHKTEIMITDSDFEKYNMEHPTQEPFKSTRSMVSSILNNNKKDDRVQLLKPIPLRYSYLIDGEETQQYLSPGVYDYPYLECKLKDVDKIHEFAFAHKTVLPGLRCDGAVIQLKNPDVQKGLGRENEKQKFEVAFKFTEEVAYTKIINIEFPTGLFGRITPVAVFEPVKLKGNNIDRASLGSYARFKNLELCKHDKVKILYDIIPYLVFDPDDPYCERSGKKVIDAPKYCVDCGHELYISESGDSLQCINKSCPCREKGKILNFCKKMNIANISYATIDTLYALNLLTKIEDIYDLKNHKAEIINISGFGENKFQNIIDEIDSHRIINPDILLGSIGIEGVSSKTFKAILEYMSLDEILSVAEDKNYAFFTVIPKIKDKTSKKVVDGINSNIETIKFLLKELLVENDITKPIFTAVFTKVERTPERKQFIVDHGGELSESLNKQTAFLVVPTLEVKSDKIEKAKKYGIPIVPIDDMTKYIEKNF